MLIVGRGGVPYSDTLLVPFYRFLLPINKDHHDEDKSSQDGNNDLSEDVTAKRIKLSEEEVSENGTKARSDSVSAQHKEDDEKGGEQLAGDGGHKREKQRGECSVSCCC